MLEDKGLETTLSFTTNLWAFHKKPSLWMDLFRHPRVGVTTSFQYGDARLKGDLTPLSEQEFINISNQFQALVGYRPDFISVIDQSNADSVLKTVQLARFLGVEAKINHVVASGPEVEFRGVTMGGENSFWTKADMYAHYVAIYDAGLMEWEYNTKQMAKVLAEQNTTCPLARDCDSGIRTLQPEQGYYSCGAFGDDRTHAIDFEREMAGEFFRPLSQDYELLSMKASCFSCPMFAICNGCRKTIQDTKRFGMVEDHCRKMKALAPKIIEINGLSGILEPTEYIDESPQLIDVVQA